MKMDGMAKLMTTLANSALAEVPTSRYVHMRRYVPMDLSTHLSVERDRVALTSGHHSIVSILGCLLDHPKHVFRTDKSILKVRLSGV
mmetsp:Transcript_17720/g.39983  ORF Transcript_17720/g.39983 Transcript_17720/m.39983 type:complete len:87 (-) Transcript_17720:1243-1503(-)